MAIEVGISCSEMIRYTSVVAHLVCAHMYVPQVHIMILEMEICTKSDSSVIFHSTMMKQKGLC